MKSNRHQIYSIQKVNYNQIRFRVKYLVKQKISDVKSFGTINFSIDDMKSDAALGYLNSMNWWIENRRCVFRVNAYPKTIEQ